MVVVAALTSNSRGVWEQRGRSEREQRQEQSEAKYLCITNDGASSEACFMYFFLSIFLIFVCVGTSRLFFSVIRRSVCWFAGRG